MRNILAPSITVLIKNSWTHSCIWKFYSWTQSSTGVLAFLSSWTQSILRNHWTQSVLKIVEHIPYSGTVEHSPYPPKSDSFVKLLKNHKIGQPTKLWKPGEEVAWPFWHMWSIKFLVNYVCTHFYSCTLTYLHMHHI